MIKSNSLFKILILIYWLIYRGEGNGTKGPIGPKGEKGDKGEGPFVPVGPIGINDMETPNVKLI